MTLLGIYFALALVVSFVCSLLEAILLSITFPYIFLVKRRHPKAGSRLEKIKQHPQRPLAAILTVNTVANTVGAAGVGAQVMELFGNEYIAIGSGILTISILIFSEIIPKSIGTQYWKQLSPFAAYFINGFVVMTYPILLLLEKVTRLVTPKSRVSHMISREEMIVSAEIGEHEGTLEKKESLIIRNLLRLDHTLVKDVMTPRPLLTALPHTLTLAQVISLYQQIPYSRIPIYEEHIDKICGIALRLEILTAVGEGKTRAYLKDLCHPAHYVYEEDSLGQVLDQFIKRQEHLFIVIDEFEKTKGIITLEDAIETLLGVDIVDETESVQNLRRLAFRNIKKKSGTSSK